MTTKVTITHGGGDKQVHVHQRLTVEDERSPDYPKITTLGETGQSIELEVGVDIELTVSEFTPPPAA